jgi:hypothetical protein
MKKTRVKIINSRPTIKVGDIVTFTTPEGKTVTEVVSYTKGGIIEGQKYDLSCVDNLRKIGQVFFALLLAVALNSCGISSNATHHHQQHLKSKHTGAHHLNSTNRGCGWANN